eukprot:15450018-Alexandrium_andersonii.AAC.1
MPTRTTLPPSCVRLATPWGSGWGGASIAPAGVLWGRHQKSRSMSYETARGSDIQMFRSSGLWQTSWELA